MGIILVAERLLMAPLFQAHRSRRGLYYRRLYRNYGAYFVANGLTPYTSQRGTCYTFIRQ